jgi:hypothetical protein
LLGIPDFPALTKTEACAGVTGPNAVTTAALLFYKELFRLVYTGFSIPAFVVLPITEFRLVCSILSFCLLPILVCVLFNFGELMIVSSKLLTDIISTPFNLVTLLIDGKLTRSSF